MRTRRRRAQVNGTPAPAPAVENVEGEVGLGDFVSPPGSGKQARRRGGRSRRHDLERAEQQVRAMREAFTEGNRRAFDAAEPKHLVALYTFLHERVYGVQATELHQDKEYMGAVSSARALVQREFDGRVEMGVAFLKWLWERERGRHRWRVREQRPLSRLGWRFVFNGGALLTDYRLHLAQKRGQE